MSWDSSSRQGGPRASNAKAMEKVASPVSSEAGGEVGVPRNLLPRLGVG